MGIRAVGAQGSSGPTDATQGENRSKASGTEADLFAAMLGSLQGPLPGLPVQLPGSVGSPASKPGAKEANHMSVDLLAAQAAKATGSTLSVDEAGMRAAKRFPNMPPTRVDHHAGQNMAASATETLSTSVSQVNAVSNQALLSSRLATSKREVLSSGTSVAATLGDGGEIAETARATAQTETRSHIHDERDRSETKALSDVLRHSAASASNMNHVGAPLAQALGSRLVDGMDQKAGVSASREKQLGTMMAGQMSQANAHKLRANHEGTPVLASTANIGQVSAQWDAAHTSNQTVDPHTPAHTAFGSVIDARASGAVTTLGTMVAAHAEQGNALLHIQVQPHGLGELQIIVTQSGNGMDVQVVASEQAAFAWLQGQLNDMQQSMQAAGLNVSSMSLSMASDGQRDRGDRSNGESRMQANSVPSAQSVARKQSVSAAITDLDARLLNLYV
ncbi:flagellar hook-length control protein FliK [Alicyclobacillus sacchari]|uniref:Flagellar hook-length control protein FliK n=1 Tax=Alicyclobacillus sacchari TaxID=392010 RepID=A0A4V3HEW0_9BACL|nr:flagellar hook-length control protein FliK [Alicyclobacillus sacchari]TDY50481.1 flagellar hook-length control protein FliK [Alicyclobacillus sacchari]GMA59008.1 hypothetical protein GCM10025858_35110 [Alicyclobacillus sacchari]